MAAVTPFKGYSQQSPEALAAVQDVRVVNATTTPIPTQNIDALKASDIVTLMFAGSATGNVFRRVLANGVMGGNEFIVPADQVLIVTDVEWTHVCSNCTGSKEITLELFGATGAHRLVYSSVASYSSNGKAGASESMETGFAVAEGGHIARGPSIGTINDNTNITIYLHGYLVPAS